ncbi:hypothetical protein BaRGS_00002468, partial [Batillaria attramentaria]
MRNVLKARMSLYHCSSVVCKADMLLWVARLLPFGKPNFTDRIPYSLKGSAGDYTNYTLKDLPPDGNLPDIKGNQILEDRKR